MTYHDDHCADYVRRIDGLSKGTLVIWQNLDRIISHNEAEDDLDPRSEFFKKLMNPESISMIFHRFLVGPRNKYLHNIYS